MAQEALDEAIAHLEELKKELETLDKGKKKDCNDLEIDWINAQAAFLSPKQDCRKLLTINPNYP